MSVSHASVGKKVRLPGRYFIEAREKLMGHSSAKGLTMWHGGTDFLPFFSEVWNI